MPGPYLYPAREEGSSYSAINSPLRVIVIDSIVIMDSIVVIIVIIGIIGIIDSTDFEANFTILPCIEKTGSNVAIALLDYTCSIRR